MQYYKIVLPLQSQTNKHTKKMNTKNYTRAELLEAQKAAILDCINEAETVEDREFYEGLLAKFSALHPEF